MDLTFPNQEICPICGREFFPPVRSEWVYRVGRALVCSYPCQSKGLSRVEVKTRKSVRPRKPVEMCNLDGGVLRTFCDANVAAALLGYSPSEIRKCCRGEYRSYRGYTWRYKEANQDD